MSRFLPPRVLPFETHLSPRPSAAQVRSIHAQFSDVALADALLAKQTWAPQETYRRYGPLVRRVLVRILGFHPDVDDLTQDVFFAAFRDIGALRDPTSLRAWLCSLATLRARKWLRTKQRWAWIRFGAPEEIPDAAAPVADDEARAAVRATYRILDRMPADERIAFCLRFFEQMDLAEVADACAVSLATVKRRLQRAERTFEERARNDDVLRARLPGGGA